MFRNVCKIILLSGLMLLLASEGCKSKKATASSSNSSDCLDPNPPKDRNCILIYKPVCGCDGKTYGNSCEAERSGVKKWKEGACEEKPIPNER